MKIKSLYKTLAFAGALLTSCHSGLEERVHNSLTNVGYIRSSPVTAKSEVYTTSDDIKKYLVTIVEQKKNENLPHRIFSGFIVSSAGHVFVPWHAIYPIYANKTSYELHTNRAESLKSDATKYFVLDSEGNVYEINPSYECADPKTDGALIKVEIPRAASLSPTQIKDAKVGDSIKIISLDYGILHQIYGSVTEFVRRIEIKSLGKEVEFFNTFRTNIDGMDGDSGYLVLSLDNSIVGMVSYGTEDEKYAFLKDRLGATTARNIFELIKKCLGENNPSILLVQ